MGNLCSSPKDKYAADEHVPSHTRTSSRKALPDFGLADHFEIIKLLGKGGEGETYLATDKRSGEIVAVKVSPSNFDGCFKLPVLQTPLLFSASWHL